MNCYSVENTPEQFYLESQGSTATRAFLPRDSISIASISSFRVCTYVSSVENSSTTNLILIIAGPSPWCFSSTISFLALVYCRSNLRTTSIRASSPNIIRSLGFLPPLGYFLEFLQFHRLDLLLHRSIPPLPSSLEFSSIKPQPRVLRSSASFRCALMSRMPRGVQISQVSSSPRSVSYQVYKLRPLIEQQQILSGKLGKLVQPREREDKPEARKGVKAGRTSNRSVHLFGTRTWHQKWIVVDQDQDRSIVYCHACLSPTRFHHQHSFHIIISRLHLRFLCRKLFHHKPHPHHRWTFTVVLLVNNQVPCFSLLSIQPSNYIHSSLFTEHHQEPRVSSASRLFLRVPSVPSIRSSSPPIKSFLTFIPRVFSD
ncbi:uncharacterized protein HKW66_Vig0079900 [Vigna angularis]|uniref:Uncharacterized protein n=1 Tax=Phaseolus angularis TaxID=3914 RepID=A0A8T0KJS5_PHAAN|nr:uncharacterized protein HKW66_Vig0079900 [Vigna angularis]